jgi:hypothetical protein
MKPKARKGLRHAENDYVGGVGRGVHSPRESSIRSLLTASKDTTRANAIAAFLSPGFRLEPRPSVRGCEVAFDLVDEFEVEVEVALQELVDEQEVLAAVR